MRTFSKLALFGLAAAGLAWWLDARSKRRTASLDNRTTGQFRTAGVSATSGMTTDAYDAIADAVEVDDLDMAGDLEALDVEVDAAAQDDLRSLMDEDVGTTSRAYVDVDRIYASENVRGGTLEDGNLYGIHTSVASDTDLTAGEAEDGFRGAMDGENWIEALEVASAEGGPLPEAEIDITDDGDRDVHARTDRRDTPIADKGAAGPAGL